MYNVGDYVMVNPERIVGAIYEGRNMFSSEMQEFEAMRLCVTQVLIRDYYVLYTLVVSHNDYVPVRDLSVYRWTDSMLVPYVKSLHLGEESGEIDYETAQLISRGEIIPRRVDEENLEGLESITGDFLTHVYKVTGVAPADRISNLLKVLNQVYGGLPRENTDWLYFLWDENYFNGFLDGWVQTSIDDSFDSFRLSDANSFSHLYQRGVKDGKEAWVAVSSWWEERNIYA